MTLDKSCFQLWNLRMDAPSEDERINHIVDWLESGFRNAILDHSEDAFSPFSGYIVDEEDVPALLKDLLDTAGDNEKLKLGLRKALGQLAGRISLTNPNEEILALIYLRTVSHCGIEESVPYLLGNQGCRLYGASNKIIYGTLQAAGFLGAKGKPIVDALLSRQAPCDMRQQFIFVATIAALRHIKENVKSESRENKILDLLQEHKDVLAYPDAFESRRQLTLTVRRSWPDLISDEATQKLNQMAQGENPVLNRDIVKSWLEKSPSL